MPEIYCNRCGTRNADTANFCAGCGAPIVPAPQPPPPPDLAPPVAPEMLFPGAAPPIRYGGFWIRFVAFIIDAIIVDAVVLPVYLVLAAAIGVAGMAVTMPGRGIQLVTIIVGSTFQMLANWIYWAWLESSPRQATVGKMALGLKVTDLNGNRISFARATGRHFAKILSGMILFIGFIIAGFTERKQALHDMIAGTLVHRS